MTFNGSEVHVGRDANNVVYGDQVNNVYRNEMHEGSLDRLLKKAAPNAFYDSEQRFPLPNCHFGTRIQMLDDLSTWIEDSSKSTRVFWLHGTAGIGKSAIAQHIAEKYADSLLAAAFFFSRNDSTRNNLEPFVASLAYQFCKAPSPMDTVLLPAIVSTIRSNPNVLDTSCENQLRRLILQPFAEVAGTVQERLPNLLIIDGIDECVDHSSQERALGIIRLLLAASPLWNILICSRPEPQIRDAFAHLDFERILRSFDMNLLEELNRDIQQYFIDQFALLRTKYQRVLRHEGPIWPEHHVIDQLVRRADRQIVFAVTIIKYIDSWDERPQDRLATVLSILVEVDLESPYSAMDVLYSEVLATCRKWGKLQPVLQLLVTEHRIPDGLSESYRRRDVVVHWRSPAIVSRLLNLKEGEIGTLLARLHSVLQIPDNEDDNVYIAHASFTEFLLDPNRSRHHHTPAMSLSEYWDCLVRFSLRTIAAVTQNYPPYRPHSFVQALSEWDAEVRYRPTSLEFALVGWKLCSQLQSPSLELLEGLSTFDPSPVITLMLLFRSEMVVLDFESVIVWGKSIQDQRTYRFAERLELFWREFHIAFRPGTLPNQVFWRSFEVENAWHALDVLTGHQATILEEASTLKEPVRVLNTLILPPAASNSLMTVPEDWVTLHLTKINGEVFRKLSAGVQWSSSGGLSLLINDIKRGTMKTVSRHLVEERHLGHFRGLVIQRLDDIRNIWVNKSPTPTSYMQEYHAHPDVFGRDAAVDVYGNAEPSVSRREPIHIGGSDSVSRWLASNTPSATSLSSSEHLDFPFGPAPSSRQMVSQSLHPYPFEHPDSYGSRIPHLSRKFTIRHGASADSWAANFSDVTGPAPICRRNNLVTGHNTCRSGTVYPPYLEETTMSSPLSLYPTDRGFRSLNVSGNQSWHNKKAPVSPLLYTPPGPEIVPFIPECDHLQPAYGYQFSHTDVDSRSSIEASTFSGWRTDDRSHIHHVHSLASRLEPNVVVDGKGKGREISIGKIVLKGYQGDVDINLRVVDRSSIAVSSGEVGGSISNGNASGVNSGDVRASANANANEQKSSAGHNGTTRRYANVTRTRPNFEQQEELCSSSQQQHGHKPKVVSGKAIHRGYWNRKGDHLTDSGYIVYAPFDKQYPPELAGYPSKDYMDPTGQIAPWVKRPELPESLPRKGRPPLQPYESFIIHS